MEDGVKRKIPKYECKKHTEHGLPHNPSHMNVRLEYMYKYMYLKTSRMHK